MGNEFGIGLCPYGCHTGNETGMTALEYAKERLFDPLVMKEVIWETDEQGIVFGCSGLQLFPRDVSKFDSLFYVVLLHMFCPGNDFVLYDDAKFHKISGKSRYPND